MRSVFSMNGWLRMAALGALVLSVGFAARAGECVNDNGEDIFHDPEQFQALISNKKTCEDAASLAESCAWGSSLDVSTVGVASQVCSAELQREGAGRADLDLLARLESRCDSAYQDMEGTLYRSANAFCRLNALR